MVAVQTDVDLEDRRGFTNERGRAAVDDEGVEVRDVEAVERAAPSRALLLRQRSLPLRFQSLRRELELLVRLHLSQRLGDERAERGGGRGGGGGRRRRRRVGRGASRSHVARDSAAMATRRGGNARGRRRGGRGGARRERRVHRGVGGLNVVRVRRVLGARDCHDEGGRDALSCEHVISIVSTHLQNWHPHLSWHAHLWRTRGRRRRRIHRASARRGSARARAKRRGVRDARAHARGAEGARTRRKRRGRERRPRPRPRRRRRRRTRTRTRPRTRGSGRRRLRRVQRGRQVREEPRSRRPERPPATREIPSFVDAMLLVGTPEPARPKVSLSLSLAGNSRRRRSATRGRTPRASRRREPSRARGRSRRRGRASKRRSKTSAR